MKNKSTDKTLRLLHKALKAFPSILKQKERAFKHKQEVLKAFIPLARKIYKLAEKNKLTDK